MTQEDKQLLLKDLSARLLYGVKVQLSDEGGELTQTLHSITPTKVNSWSIEQVDVKPYLRPMSSIASLVSAKEWSSLSDLELIDFYNANHIDYRGFIEKDLAIEVTEENNPYE